MEYLQYLQNLVLELQISSFKPYYKWNTFNTIIAYTGSAKKLYKVLNLIINGIPSIRDKTLGKMRVDAYCFKPYYKWNTFNTTYR